MYTHKKPHGRELLYYHEIFGSFALAYWPFIEYCNEQFVSVTASQIFQTLWTQGIRTQRADVHVLPGNSGFIFLPGISALLHSDFWSFNLMLK